MAGLIDTFASIWTNGFARQAARNATRISMLNAQLENNSRNFSNAAEAAKMNLGRYLQAVNNNRRLDGMANALASNTVNSLRGIDVANRSGFAASIQAAEQAGASVASAASAGVAGSVTDQVDYSTELRDSIMKQAAEDRMGQQVSDSGLRAASVVHNVVGGLDNSVMLDNFDNNRSSGIETPQPNGSLNWVRVAVDAVEMYYGMKPTETTDDAKVEQQKKNELKLADGYHEGGSSSDPANAPDDRDIGGGVSPYSYSNGWGYDNNLNDNNPDNVGLWSG